MAKMIPETEFMRRESPLPRYLPYPVFLLDTDLTMTARVIYALLLNRVSLSQMNGWVDEFGRVFVIYTIESLVHDIHKGQTTVKKALAELEDAGLLMRKRKDFGKPSHLYVKTIPQLDSPCAENQATVKK